MFTEATNSLPFTNSDTHALVVRTRWCGRDVLARLYTFRSYGLALAAWSAVAGDDLDTPFAVRSVEDPDVVATGVPTAQFVRYGTVAGAVARWLREEERATVRAILKTANHNDTFDSLVAQAKDSLSARGYMPERWAV